MGGWRRWWGEGVGWRVVKGEGGWMEGGWRVMEGGGGRLEGGDGLRVMDRG